MLESKPSKRLSKPLRHDYKQMKTLYLVRHAKAIPSDKGVTDFKRALTKTGKNDAQAMSERLRKKGIVPDLFISSPADRALETAHIFAHTFGYPLQKIDLKDEIYENNEETLKKVIKRIDDQYNMVMLFGHNPSLSNLANHLLYDFDAEIRISGVVGISFETSSWQDLSAESATLRLFDFPVRLTPKVYKKARKTIEHEIISTMEAILEDIDVEASRHLQKIMQKTSKKLAKQMLKVLKVSKVEKIAGRGKLHRVDNLSEELRSKFSET
jgi:phosphohistidine phosphatase